MLRTIEEEKSIEKLSAILDLLQDELTARDLMPFAGPNQRAALYKLIKLLKWQRRKVNEQ